MADKILKARIRLNTKSYAEWQAVKDTFIPLKGEMCVVEVPVGMGALAKEPAVLFKVGDGVKTFGQLDYASALAADVYNWAKKENLEWSDMSAEYKEELKDFIKEEVGDHFIYRIAADGAYKWKLQKSEDKGATWVDAEGAIDISNLVVELNKKVDKIVESDNGRARIFNEYDGGGAKFEHTDGTDSYVGVNDGGANGIAAQIYAVDRVTKQGARINVTKNGIYYTKANSAAYGEDDEIVVKKDIKDIAGALHFVGATELAEGETYAQAIVRLLAEKGHTPKSGDIVIIKGNASSKEFIFDGTNWIELGDEDLYVTKAVFNQEVIDRQAADEALEELVEARELEILPVSAYGFDTNLRVNQQVDGSALVDKVIELTNENKKQAVIKMGDYKFNVISIVNDEVLGVKGFAVETMNIPMVGLNDKPAVEKGIFLYNPTLGKTCTFYEKDLTRQEIELFVAQITAELEGLADIAKTGNVNDLVQTDGDYIIFDCNI